ncbi:uncharacterized protein FFNC_15695 [Fusarium fujikuroi]|nr:uncharacterized protein FFNC_15695 [Fusarium fujikuroi]
MTQDKGLEIPCSWVMQL